MDNISRNKIDILINTIDRFFDIHRRLNLHYRKEIDEHIESHHDVIDSICLHHTIADTEQRHVVQYKRETNRFTCDAGGS